MISTVTLVLGFFFSTTAYAFLHGTPVERSAYLNVVAILEQGEVMGSGALVSRNKVNTAGHCILDDLSLDFHFGRLSRLFSNLGEGFIKNQNSLFSYLISLPTLEDRRRELDRYFNAIIENRKNAVRVYFGPGIPGGRVHGEDIIERIVIHEDWINILRHRFFQAFQALEEEEIMTQHQLEECYTKVLDFAEIYLREDIDTQEVEIIRPFTADEYHAYHFSGNEVIRLVGFGNTRTFGDNDYSNSFGVKNRLDVTLNGTLSNGEYDFKVVGMRGRSAGESDSGGAAFVQLNNGTWRYLGVIVGTAPCIGYEHLFSIDNYSVKGTTLLYTRTE